MKIRLQKSQPTDDEYLMIGISTSMPDYQLSFHLNKQFHTSFKKFPDIPLYNKTGLIGHFAFYYFHEEDLRVDYYLFGNKNQHKIAVKDYKHFEFFILFKLSSFLIPIQDILKEVRQIPQIVAALQIPLEKFKILEDLLEDIELHLLECNSRTQKDAMQWLWTGR